MNTITKLLFGLLFLVCAFAKAQNERIYEAVNPGSSWTVISGDSNPDRAIYKAVQLDASTTSRVIFRTDIVVRTAVHTDFDLTVKFWSDCPSGSSGTACGSSGATLYGSATASLNLPSTGGTQHSVSINVPDVNVGGDSDDRIWVSFEASQPRVGLFTGATENAGSMGTDYGYCNTAPSNCVANTIPNAPWALTLLASPDTSPPNAVCNSTSVDADATGLVTVTPDQIDFGTTDDSGSFDLFFGESGDLTTNFTGTDPGNGMFFDIVAQEDMIIHNVGIHTNVSGAGTGILSYYRMGTWVGNGTSISNGWENFPTSIYDAQGGGSPSFPDEDLDLKITAGQRIGFYFRENIGGRRIISTTGAAIGTVAAQDDAIIIYQGDESESGFDGGIANPIIPNIEIDYSVLVDSHQFRCADSPFPVRMIAVDAAGNSDRCIAVVSANDVTPPSASCTDIEVNADAGSCDAIVNYELPRFFDECALTDIAGFTYLGVFNGAAYYISNSQFNAPAAYADAIANGGFVATVPDIATHNFIRNGADSNGFNGERILIGYNDVASEGNFVWQDGSTSTYTNWAPSSPSNSGGNEDYVSMTPTSSFGAGRWNDISDTNPRYYCLAITSNVTPTLDSGIASGGTFPRGTTQNVYSYTDGGGNSVSCEFYVTVIDNSTPEITCPADINQLECEGTAINYTVDIASGNGCSHTYPPFNNTLSGFSYLGTLNNRTYFVSNTTIAGNAIEAHAAAQGGIPATITDAATNTFIRNSVTSTIGSVGYYIGLNDFTTEGTFEWYSGIPVTYTNWTAGSPNGGANSDAVLVNTSGGWLNISAIPSTQNSRYVIEFEGTITQTAGLPSGSDFPIGTTTNTFEVINTSGVTNSCSFDVTISSDTEPPTAVCQNITVELDENGMATIAPADVDGGSTDNCTNLSLSIDVSSFDETDLGDNTVTLSVTDDAGNSDSCTAIVTIAAYPIPEITCAPDISQNIDAGTCGATVTVPSPTLMDDEDNAPLITPVIPYNVSGNAVLDTPVTITGAYAVTRDVNLEITFHGDHASSTEQFRLLGPDDTIVFDEDSDHSDCVVEVKNTVITQATWNNWITTYGTDLTFTFDPPANVDNNICATSISNWFQLKFTANTLTVTNDYNGTNDASGYYPIGTTTVIWTVEDTDGNSVNCSQDVVVTDNEVTTYTCPIDIVVNQDVGSCDAAITVPLPFIQENCPSPAGTDIITFTSPITGFDNNPANDQVPTTITGVDRSYADVEIGIEYAGDFDFATEYIEIYGPDGVAFFAQADVGSNCQVINATVTILHSTWNSWIDTYGSDLTFIALLSRTVNSANCTPNGDYFQISATIDRSTTLTAPTPAPTNDYNGTTDASDTYPLGTTTVTWSFVDADGNPDTCTQDITVEDTENPIAVCQDITVMLDSSGNANIIPSDIDGGSSDNCNFALSVNIDTFDCSNLGANTVTLTATDDAGNTDTCTATVTVVDDQGPVLTCPVNPALGTAPALATTNVAEASGYGVLYSLDIGTIINYSAGVLYTIDNSGLTDIVADRVAYYMELESGGSTEWVWVSMDDFTGNILTEMGIPDLSDNNFGHENTVTNMNVFASNGQVTEGTGITTGNVEIWPTNYNGNANSGLGGSNVLDFDDTRNGNGNYGSFQVHNYGAGETLLALNRSNRGQTCDIGIGNSPTGNPDYTFRQNAGDYTARRLYVLITDVPQISITLDAMGNATAAPTDFNITATDNCGGTPTTSLSQTNFTCDHLGANTIQFTATDASGNATIKDVIVNVLPFEPTTITCPADVTVSNDAGNCDAFVTVPAPTVNEFCNTGMVTIVNDYNGTADASDTYPVGITTVTWTATDVTGATSTCTMIVTVEDTEDPQINCPSDIIVTNDTGNCSAIVTYPLPTITDNCAFTPVELSQHEGVVNLGFDCTSTQSGHIRIFDLAPEALANDFELQEVSIGIRVSSGSPELDVNIYTTDQLVDDITEYGVPLSNSITPVASATVTVPDGINFMLDVPISVTVPSDAEVIVEIVSPDTADFLIGYSNNNTTETRDGYISCNGSLNYSTPSSLGFDNAVVLDISGQVTNITMLQTAGLPSGSDFPVGSTTNTFEVTDLAGNTSTCSFNVIVEDGEEPLAVCQNITVQLDSTGTAIITPNQIDNGSTDNCGIDVFNLSQDTFNCADLGDNTITFSVTDFMGNTASCTAIVTVEDNEAPTITCVADSLRDADVGVCTYTIQGAEFDPSFEDNCATAIITNDLNGSESLGGEILPLGDTTVTWTVDDGNGQTATCTTTITVEDNEAPTITCVANATRDTDAGTCDYTVQGAEFDPSFTDNCTTATISNDFNNAATLDGAILPQGDTTITWTVDDGNGQTATCTTTVTVEDNEAPAAVCQNITVQLDDLGMATITPADVDGGSTDNCGIAALSISSSSSGSSSSIAFDCSNVGDNTITLTVTDTSGNTSTCDAIVTVEDNIASVITCQDITIQLDDTGAASITAADVTGVSDDACGVASASIDIDTFNCDDVGTNTVTLTVTDVNGNSSTCTATVTVEDIVSPTVVTQDITVELDALGMAFITPDMIDNGSSDNCAIDALELDIDQFDCSNIGDNTVTLTVTDFSGNTSAATAVVTVEDNIPVAVVSGPVDIFTGTGANDTQCETIVNYEVGIEAFVLDDNCGDGMTTVTIEQTSGLGSGAAFPVGTTVEEYTLIDNNGNTTVYTFEVTVADTTLPVIICPEDLVVGTTDGTYTIEDYTSLASDNCSTGTDLLVTQDPAPGTVLSEGDEVTVTIMATDTAGNPAECSFTITVNSTLSVEEETFRESVITLYPVPTTGVLNIDANVLIDRAEIYDLRGRLVQRESFTNNEYQLDITNAETGVYLIYLIQGDQVVTKRVIKE